MTYPTYDENQDLSPALAVIWVANLMQIKSPVRGGVNIMELILTI
jgi:hypothetical protein